MRALVLKAGVYPMGNRETVVSGVVSESLAKWLTEKTPQEVAERYAGLKAAAAAADFGEFDQNLVIIDTETTGFSLNHDELTQIAAARMKHGEITDWFITFVNPGKPIPDDVAHLTNIHDEDVADAPIPSEALAQLVEFVGDAKLVAHNAEFDRNFTTKHPAGYPLLENTWLDSLDLARIALPRLKSHRLIDLVKAFDAPLSTHRADADVAATCALFRILLAAVEAMPAALVKEIAGMATPEQWPTVTVFEYFAQKNSEPGSFSLRKIRAERTQGAQTAKAKNDAEKLASNPQRPLKFPSLADIKNAFAADGLVGQLYPDFEPREEQLAMAQAVRDAFTSSENLMVEAGTGVGKSMAYLVPAAMTAQLNNISVGVATKTNALLDQLVYQELPALARYIPNLTFASLKGFSHYPCLRRIERIVHEGAQMRTVNGNEYSQAPALAALLSYIEQTEYDDMDALKIDYRVLPRRSITCTSNECLRRKCPYYGTACFVHGARRKAETVDIVVTNHSFLFCDVAAESGLLPPARYWVVDEAHNAEQEARRALSVEITAESLGRIVSRVQGTDANRNVFVRAERKASGSATPAGSEAETLLYALASKAKAAGETFTQAAGDFTAHMKDLLFFDTSKRSKGYEFVEIWLNDDVRGSETFRGLVGFGLSLSDASEKLITASQELVGFLEGMDGVEEIQREIATIALELKELVQSIDLILKQNPETFVYSATISRKNERPTDKLEALLFNVGDALNETLYANTHSVVYTSATMTVGDSFAAFESALGLNQGESSIARTCRLNSSYDYDQHMTIYVPNDLPEPNEPSYLAALQSMLLGVHLAQEGSTLTLFTNRKEMESCFDAVQPQLKREGLRLVCQKWGVSIKGLRDDFLADEHLSLFALKSFWEGFDAPGATLKAVVIPKLPFAKPSDPLSCERSARDDAAWRKYVLPAAVLETKQAAGRLIRKADDRGILVLADKRLLTKNYGKVFLASMPSSTIKVCSVAEMVADIEENHRR